MRIRSSAIASGVLIALASVLHAQDGQTPNFRAGVEALPIDVVVLDDRGQPIRDLIAADFTIRIDGRARRVISTQWISAAAGAKAASAPFVPEGYVSNETSTGGRLLALVVDQPNIPFGDMRPIRDAMNAFVDRLSPSDRLAVIGLGQPSMTTPFLGDKNQIKEAIARVPGQKVSVGTSTQHDIRITQALAIADGDESAVEIVAARDCPNPQRQLKQCDLQEEIRAMPSRSPDSARQAGSLTLGGLRELFTSLRTIDSPKALIYVSQASSWIADAKGGTDRRAGEPRSGGAHERIRCAWKKRRI
jgi:VWFA-related protein